MKAKNNDLEKNNLDSEEIHTGFINLSSGPRQIKYLVVDGLAIFEGDIVLGTVEEMKGFLSADAIITGNQYLWPDGIIPYKIHSSLTNQQRVTDAISHWENRTFIRFIPQTTEANYVTFRPSSGCSSSIGMRGIGEQFINLGSDCSIGNVIHEIGHTVGLFHEQSREDRDTFVKINWENIEPEKESNFDKAINESDDCGPYDYGSIMHYGPKAFSRNALPTIEPKSPLPPGVVMGQRNGLSNGDVDSVSALYNRETC